MEENTLEDMIRTKTKESRNNSHLTRRNKNTIMLKNYYNNLYHLENQALSTSFGKMINAKNQTNPKYSFGKEKRFFTIEKNDDLPYLHQLLEDEKYGNVNIGYHNHIKGGEIYNSKQSNFNKSYNLGKNNSPQRFNTINFVSGGNNATDYYYVPPPTHQYKFPKLPRYSFGKEIRDTAKKIKTYDYYKLSYDKKTDRENIDKKWSTRIIGGDIGIDERFIENRKLYNETLTPGPGRYNPNYNYFKYKQNKYGYMGIKIKDDKIKVSTDGPKMVSLSPYNIQHLIGSNQKNIKLNKSIKNYENKYKIISNKLNILRNSPLRGLIEGKKSSNGNESLNRSEN
jgi:hypothetical protein